MVRLQSGRSFCRRSVTLRQGGRSVFVLLCSFHCREAGPSFQLRGSDLPLRDMLRRGTGASRDMWTSALVDERVPAPEELLRAGHEETTVTSFGPGPERTIHVAAGPRWGLRWAKWDVGPCEPAEAPVVLAYLSDFAVIDVMQSPLRREGYRFQINSASLDG